MHNDSCFCTKIIEVIESLIANGCVNNSAVNVPSTSDGFQNIIVLDIA